jgi:diguanylate cyclase (GGDEF)-like protein
MAASTRRGARVWLLIGALVALSSAAWQLAGHAGRLPTGFRLGWFGLGLLCVTAEWLRVRIEIRGDSYDNNFGVLALALGLVLANPVTLVISRVASTILLALARRRVMPTKIVFNATNRVLETGIAVIVFRMVVGRWIAPLEPRTIAAMIAAVMAAEIVTSATVNVAIAITVGRLQFSVWQASVAAGFAVTESALALLTLNVLWADWRALWLIALLTFGVWAIYRAYVRVRSHYASLDLLYRFTDALSGSTELNDVSRRTLELARELLRATHAELLVPVPDGVVIQRLGPDNELTTEVRRHQLHESIYTALFSPDAVLISRSGHHPLRHAAADRGWTDVAAAPLITEDNVTGVLIVANRLANVSEFTNEDLRLLQTFARNTAIALRVSDLVEELRREGAEKEFRADHDPLTGLANRSLLAHRLEALLGGATQERQVALFFMDLDGFKEVNDALGHHTGDVLLVEIARRLQHVIGRRGTVARLGGDEFAIALADLTRAEALAVAREVQSAVESPVELDNLSIAVRVSTGIAFAPQDANDMRTLLQRADGAMYVAKDRRSGTEVYDEKRDKSGSRRLTLASELRAALASNELQLHYQPQVDLRTGQVQGLEALARWPHPCFGSVPPDEFIPIAEHSGLIHELTRWALHTALADLARWRRRWPWISVSVNLSARNLLDASLAGEVEAALVQSGVPAEALTLELTESSVMADPHRSLIVLEQLHTLGIRLAIDDYGTGYSSLAYLKRLPVAELKIDKSFVLHMTTDTDDTMIVRSTIDLAHNLGLETVAEGVEDEETRKLLHQLGCNAIQGYHLTRPLNTNDTTNWLRQHIEGDEPTPGWEPLSAFGEASARSPVALSRSVWDSSGGVDDDDTVGGRQGAPSAHAEGFDAVPTVSSSRRRASKSR